MVLWTANGSRRDDLHATMWVIFWMMALWALVFGWAEVVANRGTSWGSRKEGPSTERVTATGPVTTIEVQDMAGLVCIAYPGLVVRQESREEDEVNVVVDEAAIGVADANGCQPGTRGVVDARRWGMWSRGGVR